MTPTESFAPLEISTVDCDYIESRFAAAYVVTEESRSKVAIVDTNTEKAVPKIIAALAEKKLSPDQVTHILITHAHLDHAAGTGSLARLCKNATIYAHPKAARHLIDPSRLVASARAVYGAERFDMLYGRVEPIEASRVVSLDDGALVAFGAETFQALQTLGHATHHVAYFAEKSRVLFTGDTFGLFYPKLQRTGFFIFPSTSPTDFDPEEALKTIDRLSALKPSVLFPTHFGPVKDTIQASTLMKAHYQFFGELLGRATARNAQEPIPELTAWIAGEIMGYLRKFVQNSGLTFNTEELKLLHLDLELNAQGVAYTATKRRQKPTQ